MLLIFLSMNIHVLHTNIIKKHTDKSFGQGTILISLIPAGVERSTWDHVILQLDCFRFFHLLNPFITSRLRWLRCTRSEPLCVHKCILKFFLRFWILIGANSLCSNLIRSWIHILNLNLFFHANSNLDRDVKQLLS